jgi:two-component system response regulator HydG
MTRVLLVDDDAPLRETLALSLGKRGFSVADRKGGAEALAAIAAEDWDVVVADLNMPGIDGIELCERVVGLRPDIPVIVLTAFGSMETAVAAIRVGAYDFLAKPIAIDSLEIAVRRAANHRALHEQVARLKREVRGPANDDAILGDSQPIRELLDVLGRLADSDASVMVTGESGVGKEIVSRAIHAKSPRARGPFVAINCAAMPEALLESELFGHARGAFTDAREAHVGLFQQANGGTVFLDEIGDMPIGLQPKLLRVLEQRTVRPVGARHEVPIDVRVVSATNRDLEEAMEQGLFREDLYFRLNVVALPVPPLRARGTDVLTLAAHFVRDIARRGGRAVTGLTPAAAERLLSYSWPGNVRELKNAMERGVALARFDQIGVEDLPERIRAYKPSHVVVAAEDPSELVPLEEVERRYVGRVLEAVAGNKTAAAKILGIERKRLYRMIERHGLAKG